MSDTMRIIRLEAENFMRLSAVTIEPDGSTVVIGGQNGAGKSSILNAIEAAFGGKKAAPKKPIKEGEKRSRIVVELDDIIVTREFTPGGKTSLVVKAKDGASYDSPQAMLDGLFGSLSFDPQAFARQAPKVQAETLRELAGLDFVKVDAERAQVFAERTDINRDEKRATARLAGMTRHDDAPSEAVSVAELSAELGRIQSVNAGNESKREELESLRVEAAEAGQHRKAVAARGERNIKQTTERVERARAALAEEEETLVSIKAEAAEDDESEAVKIGNLKAEGVKFAAIVGNLVDEDAASVRAQIDGAEAANEKVRDNEAHASAKVEADSLGRQSRALTERLGGIDDTKAKMISGATYPIDGLTVDSDGVQFDGVPLAQASSAQQLRVATGIGIALNPKLKVVLIRDGSLLDADSLAMVKAMADKAGSQLVIERVGDGAEVGIVIEDGAVKEDRTKGNQF